MPEHRTAPTTDDPLLTRRQLAERLIVEEDTLRAWERAGRGPERLLLGPQTVRYRTSAVARWLDECAAAGRPVTTPAPTGGAA